MSNTAILDNRGSLTPVVVLAVSSQIACLALKLAWKNSSLNSVAFSGSSSSNRALAMG